MRVPSLVLGLLLAGNALGLLGASVRGTITSGDGGGGSGGGMSLPTDTVFTSEASPAKFCGIGPLTGLCYYIFVRSDGVPTITTSRDGVLGDTDIQMTIDTGNLFTVYDGTGNVVMEFEPDVSGMLNKVRYGTNYRPRKSIWFSALQLVGDGTNCPQDPSPVTIASGPKQFTFICADNSGSRLDGHIKMRPSWDGGSITFEHVSLQSAGDTGALRGSIVAQCRNAGEVASNTWSADVFIEDASVSGGQKYDFTKSAAITPSGSCTGGSLLFWKYVLDAAGTTTATATLHHYGFMMEYSVFRWSD